MGTGKGKKQETQLQQQAQQAYNEVKPSDYELYQKPLDLQLLKDLNSGKDVRDVEGLRWNLNLFNNAGKDPDVSGQGLLGQNQLTGANSNMMGLIGQQLKARQEQENQGQLYNSVIDAKNSAQDRSLGFAGMEGNRQMGRAELANNRYTAYLNRPRKPSFWENLLMGGLSAGAQIGAAAV